MKYFVLFGIIFAVIWWLKLSRESSSNKAASSDTPSAQNMVACLQCGLHLPENEAVNTNTGFYCSESHRHIHEGR